MSAQKEARIAAGEDVDNVRTLLVDARKRFARARRDHSFGGDVYMHLRCDLDFFALATFDPRARQVLSRR